MIYRLANQATTRQGLYESEWHPGSLLCALSLSAMYNAKLREGQHGKRKESYVLLASISCSGMSANSFLR